MQVCRRTRGQMCDEREQAQDEGNFLVCLGADAVFLCGLTLPATYPT